MLSYLKDGSNGAPAAANMETAPAQPGDGLCQQQDFLTVSGHGKKLRQSTMTLIVLFVVGALVVWFMVKKTTPAAVNAAPSEDQVQLETALTQLNTMQTEMNSQMDSVVGKFYQFSSVEQIEVNELKKNPFKRESADVRAALDPRTLAETELNVLRDRAQRQAASLELWSITSTPKGKCCMVNDKVLYEGDNIDGLTVTKIGDKTVSLEFSGVFVELMMSE